MHKPTLHKPMVSVLSCSLATAVGGGLMAVEAPRSPQLAELIPEIEEVDARPNIVVIMLDDMGFSDIGCFGSEIKTPNLDRMAAQGLRFTQFYNTARCCPSRSSLMTGLYPHQAGVGFMDSNLGSPSYEGRLNSRCATVAELLGEAGYRTIMSGKWHLGTGSGDKPWERGFQRFYGIPAGGGVYFWPTILDRPVVRVEAGEVTPVNPGGDWFSTDAFTDYAVEQIGSAANDQTPFFLYLPYIAPHFPHQAKEEDIKKHLGTYMQGWGAARHRRYEKQIELGIIDAKHNLPESQVRPWDQLTKEQKVAMDRQMAVYAALMDNLDQNVGRVLQALEENNLTKNTLVLFFSDNGATDSLPLGWEKRKGASFGTRESFGCYAEGWAEVSNTPFRQFKMFAHHGGTASPMLAYWPGVVKAGGIRHQPLHIVDVVPTCLELAGVAYPEMFQDKPIQPLAGLSFTDLLQADAERPERSIFWEHMGNAGVRVGRWKLVRLHKSSWELYDLNEDLTETIDLAKRYPERVKEMIEMWNAWAADCGVLPWPVRKDRGAD